MKRPWTILKDIIGTYEQQKGILLSVIDEKGQIVCANANMIKTLHLKNPRVEKISFFDLLHPVNLSEFKTALDMASESNGPIRPMEVYLKNGYYHPMKWEINYIKSINGSKSYLCVGHKLLDDNRLRQFNILGEKNYQLIVEGINAGILFQDKRGELIAVNQKLAEVLNTTLERLYQLTDIEDLWNTTWSITGEDGGPIKFENTPFMQALKTGKQQTEVLVFKLKGGEYRWLHFTSQPLFEDNDPQPYSVVTNVVDLTYEKRLVLEIQERKALFRSFMSQTPNLTWVVDKNSTLLFASDAFYKYFGLTEISALNILNWFFTSIFSRSMKFRERNYWEAML
jgi:PAS domain-containing protein